jgi:hypothetical protein
MAKKVQDAIGRAFEREMGERLPDFQRRTDIKVPPGDQVYSRKVEGLLTFFVVLELNPKWASFGVSLAWNAEDDEMVQYLAMLPTDEPFRGRLRFGLHALWDVPSSSPWPWEVEPAPRLEDPATWTAQPPSDDELVKRAEDLAANAVAEIEEFGEPYFEKVLREIEASQGAR